MEQPSPLWTSNTSEVRMTGTWRSAVPDYRTLPSPCHGACPVSGEIAVWIQQIKNAKYKDAWLTLVENNPFPAIAGRICHHPCEGACNRHQLDDTVGICNLERFVGDMALAEGWQFSSTDVQSQQSVAIIGAGPAGLSAAYQLRRRGYNVAIYESNKALGGLMRYGIPAYRLEKKILDGEIERIINLGIHVHLEAAITSCDQLEQLRSEHDAVYFATGATRSKQLPNLDYSHPWVVDSAEFLASTNAGKDCKLGKKLLVVGGGSAAIDVARTGRRLGRDVTVMSLEPEDSLPAQKIEVLEAIEEGIIFVTASMMQSTEESKDGIMVHCVKVDFMQGATKGEFKLEPQEESEFTLLVDAIIPSIGQDVDLALWQQLLESVGSVIKTDNNFQTTMPGVFAGGDVATMERFVTKAIGMGKEAALAIDRYINPVHERPVSTEETEVPYSVINTHYHPLAKQNLAENIAVSKRIQNFGEVQQPLTASAAIAESNRCFSCGTCTNCDSCFFHCPDMAITKLQKGYEVKTDYCKGCGLCVAECPTGSIIMLEES